MHHSTQLTETVEESGQKEGAKGGPETQGLQKDSTEGIQCKCMRPPHRRSCPTTSPPKPALTADETSLADVMEESFQLSQVLNWMATNQEDWTDVLSALRISTRMQAEGVPDTSPLNFCL